MAHTSQRRNQLSPLCLHLISGQTRPEENYSYIYETVIVATHHRNYRALSVGTKM